MPVDPTTGVIHDIGYQRYQGVRLGRGPVVRSVYVHSLRTAFGLGRSARAKVLPIGLLGLTCVVALLITVISTRMPVPLMSYVGMTMNFAYPAAAFVAIVGPELVSRDLRNSLLPLYFSRPLGRTDYAMTKLAALTTAVFAILAAPELIMFLGMAFSEHNGIAGVPAEALKFLYGLIAAAIAAILFAAIAVPLAALTGRRVFATGMVIGLFLLTAPVASVLGMTGYRYAGLFSPITLISGVDNWLFGAQGTVDASGAAGPVYALVTLLVIGAGTGLSVLRYRTVKA